MKVGRGSEPSWGRPSPPGGDQALLGATKAHLGADHVPRKAAAKSKSTAYSSSPFRVAPERKAHHDDHVPQLQSESRSRRRTTKPGSATPKPKTSKPKTKKYPARIEDVEHLHEDDSGKVAYPRSAMGPYQ